METVLTFLSGFFLSLLVDQLRAVCLESFAWFFYPCFIFLIEIDCLSVFVDCSSKLV